ncbi:DUF2187 family protein [Pradoshia sp.]|uniref:DUF2187 family protein n=1 Tax=Pradoshia sp. TaxID=2651281 RepID=UPI003F01C2C1
MEKGQPNENLLANMANIGDVVEFKRRDLNIIGKVSLVKELSCIVDIDLDVATYFGYETPKTVVRHGNYKIISSPESVYSSKLHAAEM